MTRGKPLSKEQYSKIIETMKLKREHTIFFTERMPLFETLYNDENTSENSLLPNKRDPTMVFSKEYKLSTTEMDIFKTLIGLTEEDFNYYYIPYMEKMLRKRCVEKLENTHGILYVYSRKYNIMHSMTDQSKLTRFSSRKKLNNYPKL